MSSRLRRVDEWMARSKSSEKLRHSLNSGIRNACLAKRGWGFLSDQMSKEVDVNMKIVSSNKELI